MSIYTYRCIYIHLYVSICICLYLSILMCAYVYGFSSLSGGSRQCHFNLWPFFGWNLLIELSQVQQLCCDLYKSHAGEICNPMISAPSGRNRYWHQAFSRKRTTLKWVESKHRKELIPNSVAVIWRICLSIWLLIGSAYVGVAHMWPEDIEGTALAGEQLETRG